VGTERLFFADGSEHRGTRNLDLDGKINHDHERKNTKEELLNQLKAILKMFLIISCT
jgi:hypothetical protein